MTPEQEREAFVEALKADRYDQTTRLVFADWLLEHDEPEEAAFQRAWTPEWQQSADWVRDFCQRVNLNHGYFLEKAAKCLDEGDGWDGIDVYLDTSNATVDEDMAEVWRHVGVVLRREVDALKMGDPFSCGEECYPSGLDWEDGEQ